MSAGWYPQGGLGGPAPSGPPQPAGGLQGAGGLSRPWLSTVPFVFDALFELLQQGFAARNSPCLVKDGQWTSEESGQEYLILGWPGFAPGYQYPSRSMSDELGAGAVNGVSELYGLGPSELEKYSIACASLARVGQVATDQARSRVRHTAFRNAHMLGEVLKPPASTINGLVQQVCIGGNFAMHLVTENRGPMVVLTFTLEIDAFSQQ